MRLGRGTREAGGGGPLESEARLDRARAPRDPRKRAPGAPDPSPTASLHPIWLLCNRGRPTPGSPLRRGGRSRPRGRSGARGHLRGAAEDAGRRRLEAQRSRRATLAATTGPEPRPPRTCAGGAAGDAPRSPNLGSPERGDSAGPVPPPDAPPGPGLTSSPALATPPAGSATPLQALATPPAGSATPLQALATPPAGSATPLQALATPPAGSATLLQALATPLQALATPPAGSATPLQALATPRRRLPPGRCGPLGLKPRRTLRGVREPRRDCAVSAAVCAGPEFEKESAGRGEADLVPEHFSQAPQKLSFYSWYGSVRLFHFRVPPDTARLHWLLHASQESSRACPDVEITVHFRAGAPPVINPLGTSFSNTTSVRASFRIRTLFSTMLLGNTSVNISHPAPGDWFVAAHLPPSSQKIEVKDFVSTCAYIFQPDMLVMRMVEVSILEPDVPLLKTLLSRPTYLKVFVPEYTQELRLELQGCASKDGPGCPVQLTVGTAALPRNFQKVLTCSSLSPSCHVLLPSPPWGRWLQVVAESLAEPPLSVAFSAEATLTACRPWRVTLHRLGQNSSDQSNDTSADQLPRPGPRAPGPCGRECGGPLRLLTYPLLREDVDVLSVRFQPLDGVTVLLRPDSLSVMRLHLDTGMDSGGSFTVTLRANETEITNSTLIAACVNAASPFLRFNASLNCTTAFFQGYPLSLNTLSPTASLTIPYPETDSWYLSLQLVCPESPRDCEQARVRVETTLYLTPCLDDCGPYGQCLLLRRHSYVYAGCSCKAGWRGWSCTDNGTAQTVAQQKAAALLLTLSNLMFLAPIAVSVHRAFLVEAFVYLYTMFFSTFYHACDQPGEAMLCILNYDTLQYCDFLGSGASTWVTILCMARLKTVLKHILFVLGTLVMAMSLQLDRRGIWNLMGPCLFAFVIMSSMWVYRCGHRRQCYPTSWQRWVFYLLPGISMASVGIAIYTSMMTSDNYYYTHSIWHMLLAGGAAFLLPPREEQVEPWACSQKLPCHYQICRNDRDELYTVT
ncbi:post-GPI attachment to proteins factor 6-like [Dipodomys merriami]|uniref:post-GPI attachment to proteins factor 6-like n=1 Tax=Dipodomys merriami TaxID=94247 RepID=UPI003855B31A